ncbi:MAG: RHS repeat-associated core domain-containing protein [Bacillota bacterium]
MLYKKSARALPLLALAALLLAMNVLMALAEPVQTEIPDSTTVSNLMNVLKEEKQKAVYDVNLNAPFSKEKSGINEDISTETGELSLRQTLLDLPGRNGMDLVLKAKYRSRDAKLFDEATRSGAITNTYGSTVVAHYDVFDKDGYWLKQMGLVYTTDHQTILGEWQNGEEKWVFNGYLTYQSGGSLFTSGSIANATQEQSKAINARYLLGTGWAFDMPFLDVDGDSVFVHLHDGTTYKADFNSGSGLEKYELKDLLFDKNTSFGCGTETSAYRLHFKNGDEFFFSPDGFLIGQRDKYHNTIRYYYQEVSGFKVLTKIEDTVGRVVNIGYNDTATIISSGKKRVTLMKRLIPGQTNKYYLAGFTDPAGRETRYQYTFDTANFDSVGKAPAVNTYANLVEIRYPTGAKTQYSYTRGQKNLGTSGSMEYFKVSNRHDRDGEKISNLLDYRYSNEPDGYPAYKDSSQLPDNYRYNTSVRNSKGLTTRYVFDGRHLPIFRQVAGDRVMSEAYTSYHGRYKLPVQVRERLFNSSKDYLERVSFYDYDSRGNLISENHPTKQSEFTSSERKIHYKYDSRYNLLVSKRYKKDKDTTVEVKYSLTPDGREAALMESFANDTLMGRESYRYDEFGNLISTTAKKTGDEDVTINLEYSPEYGHAYLTAKSAQVKDADGGETTVTSRTGYDFATGNITSQADGNGNVTLFKYDLLDRLLESANPDGTVKTYEYDDTKNIAHVTDENQNRAGYFFDGLGRLSTVQEEQQGITLVSLKYDDQYNVLQETNPNGSYKEYTYDQAGRLISVGHRDSSGQSLAETAVEYNEAVKDQSGTLQKITAIKKTGPGKNDLITNYYFDLHDRLVKQGRVQDGDEYFARFTYDYLGSCTQKTDLKGNQTSYSYDGLGRLIQKTNPLGNSRKYEYDYMGNQVAAIDELGNITRARYDSLGRVTKRIAPFEIGRESISKYYYDNAGNTVKTIDPEGGVTRFQYNQRNLVSVVEKELGSGESNFVRYSYDSVGNRTGVHKGLSSLSDTARAITKYQYDSLGRIVSFTDPSGKSELYRYDNNGNLITSFDRNGKRVKYAYDGLDRLVKKQIAFNGRLETVEYSYDLLGNRTRMTDTRGATTYEYDSLSRLTGIRQDNGINLNYAYDILDRRVSMTLQQNRDVLMDIGYTYNELGLLTQVREQGRSVHYEYDKTNRPVASINGVTGIKTSYRYNPGGLLVNMVNQRDSEILSSFQYEYDRRGNQTKKVDQDGVTRYYYDSMSRLKAAVLPNNLTQSYIYDNLGNLTGLVEIGESHIKDTSYTYDRNSRLLLQEERQGDEVTKNIFGYDNNGNQVEKSRLFYREDRLVYSEETSFRFDDLNQLRETETPDGKLVQYSYSGDGLRTGKDIDGDYTGFTYDGGNIILETDGEGLPKARNFFGLNLVSRHTAEDVYYYLFNGHGDVVQLTDEGGEIVKDYRYDPFGKELEDQLPLNFGKPTMSLWRAEIEKLDNPFRYAGEYLDQETGFYYLRARYYDPEIQRFISEDSYAKSPGWGQHVYAYCGYDPVNLVDPSGHDPNYNGWAVLAQQQAAYDAKNNDAAKRNGSNYNGWALLGTNNQGSSSSGNSGIIGIGVGLPPGIGLAISMAIGNIHNYMESMGYYFGGSGGSGGERIPGSVSLASTLVFPLIASNFTYEYEDPNPQGNIYDPVSISVFSIFNSISNEAKSWANAWLDCPFTPGGAVKSTGKEAIKGVKGLTKPLRGIGGKGWRGDKVWKNAVNSVKSGGTIESINGNVPTQQEAKDLIIEAGGIIDRIEGPHMAPNPHSYPHINYTTPNGKKGTIRIQE